MRLMRLASREMNETCESIFNEAGEINEAGE